MSELVLSMTALPGRFAHLERVLEYLGRQSILPDVAVLWLPTSYTRQLVRYPATDVGVQVPPWLEVRQCEDLGPFTKLGHTLKLISEPDTIIVTCDDDMLYPNTWLEGLVEGINEHENAAIGYRGRLLPCLDYNRSTCRRCPPEEDFIECEIITGCWGAAYRRCFFDDEIFEVDRYDGQFYTDDIWISGNLARRGIRRLLVSGETVLAEPRSCARDPLWGINAHATHNNNGLRFFGKHWGWVDDVLAAR